MTGKYYLPLALNAAVRQCCIFPSSSAKAEDPRFADASTASRGWSACADHDVESVVSGSNWFGYFINNA
jgi:hypothetical protein